MRTDELFYELFRLDPRSLFKLVRLKLKGEYTFESITIKTTEKRLDGFFKPKDGRGPLIFLEVQGYLDVMIYWRIFREICTWYEQNEANEPFVAIILFVDEKYDPGNCMLTCLPPSRFIRCNLPDCLNYVGDNAGALSVLKPLTFTEEEKLPEAVQQWQTEIRSLELSERKMKNLMELLIYAILQRFPALGRKELDKMLNLTPLEETTAFKEIVEITMDKGLNKGREEGKLIGQIQLAQRLMGKPLIPTETLVEKSIDELSAILDALEPELSKIKIGSA